MVLGVGIDELHYFGKLTAEKARVSPQLLFVILELLFQLFLSLVHQLEVSCI